MTKQKMAVLSACALIAVFSLTGCGSKKVAQPSGIKVDDTESASQSEQNGKTAMTYKTLNALLAANEPLSCSWSKTDENGESSGKIFVSGKKFRSDIVIGGQTEAGEEKLEIEMHNLSDGAWVYTWNSMPGSKAIKMDLSKMEAAKPAEETKPEGNVNFEEELNYDCAPWDVDESVFNLPSDIQFTDETEAMNQLIDTAQNLSGAVQSSPADGQAPQAPAFNNTQICQACQMAPAGEARDACLKNAKCGE